MNQRTMHTLLILLMGLLITACGGTGPTPAPAPTEAPPAATEPAAEATEAPSEEPVSESDALTETATITSSEAISPAETITGTEPLTESATITEESGGISIGEEVVTIEHVRFQTAPLLPGTWSGGWVEQNIDEMTPPDMTQGPRRLVISGTVALSDGTQINPYLFVYDVADLAETSAQPEADALAELLASNPTEPDLAGLQNLPYLPLIGAPQVIHAAEQLISFGNGSGVRYVTAFFHDASPLISTSFQYTFQGLSADGQYYVALLVPLQTELFPEEFPAEFPAGNSAEEYGVYLTESQTLLTEAAADAFLPDLTTLDSVVHSLTVGEEGFSPEQSSASAPELVGIAWQLSTLTAADGSEISPDDPSRYTLVFGEDGHVAVVADCNQGGGEYAAEAGSLTMGALISTLAACPEGSLDTVFMQQIGQATGYTVDGDVLTLTLADGSSITLTAEDTAMETDAARGTTDELALVGPVWQLRQILYSDDTVLTPSDPSRYTVTFGEDGQATVQADCNRGGGSYTADESSVAFGPLMSTRMACPDDSFGTRFLQDLEAAATYLIQDGALHIALKVDTGIMEFTPAE